MQGKKGLNKEWRRPNWKKMFSDLPLENCLESKKLAKKAKDEAVGIYSVPAPRITLAWLVMAKWSRSWSVLRLEQEGGRAGVQGFWQLSHHWRTLTSSPHAPPFDCNSLHYYSSRPSRYIPLGGPSRPLQDPEGVSWTSLAIGSETAGLRGGGDHCWEFCLLSQMLIWILSSFGFWVWNNWITNPAMCKSFRLRFCL